VTPLAQRVRKALLGIDGVVESGGIFGNGDVFRMNGKQMAHSVRDGALKLRLSKPVIRDQRGRLRDDPRLERPRTSSDWLTARFDDASDVPFIIELATTAVRVCIAAPETTPETPPQERSSPACSSFTDRR
jgi:hypothetical protein